ncbi:guanylate kinase [Succinivibrio dextrinosolvens]|uniref:guanylate kinase n=2 Tax=Succinivibrio dextrinosolvens TaxID=83771 RepID=UPI001E4AF187|nr:guanylate kinase [Succinivibrio dextrinosolvens]
MMKKGTLYIVSAPSGAGKSSLIDSILKRFNLDDSLRLSVSHTTRQPRPGEVDHVSYHFVSNEEFEALIARGAFYEYAHVFDHYYGTSKEIVEQWLNEGKDVLLDIDWQGARQIREQTPDAKGIFIIPPSLEELHRRLVSRATDAPEVIEKRMNKAIGEISHYDEYDYVIINDDFEESVLNMRSIILANRAKLDKKKEEISKLFDLNKN